MSRMKLLCVTALAALTLAGMPVAAKTQDCPPGLAKKAVPCVPPGQVGKSYRADDDHDDTTDQHHHDWQYGDRIGDDYILIPRSEWERLALRDYADNSAYVQVDNQILRVVRDTLTVIEAVRILGNVIN